MTMDHEHMLDDVAVYALGTMNERDAARVREHLRDCAACRAEYAELSPAIAAIATAEASAETPGASPLLKARIMREVRASSGALAAGTRARRAPAWPAYLVAAASFALAIGLGLLNLNLNERLHRAQTELAQSHASGTTVAAAPIDEAVLDEILSEHAARTPVSGGEIVRVNGHLYLAMHDLPPPPKGRVYQAWTQVKGKTSMRPSSTFVPDRRGIALVPVASDAAKVAAVAVSVEPPGGSKAPTSAPVLLQHLD